MYRVHKSRKRSICEEAVYGGVLVITTTVTATLPYSVENNPWAYIRKFDHLTNHFVDQIFKPMATFERWGYFQQNTFLE